jgi:hypothetical protein
MYINQQEKYTYTQPDVIETELLPVERPTFSDLVKNAHGGFVKKAVARYLMTNNPDRSIKAYTYLGMPILRGAIMKTYGRLYPKRPMSNYRLDASKNRIEAATRFAVGGSAANEAVHSIGAVWMAVEYAQDIIEPGLHSGEGSTIAALVLNVALVGLQRYNRARMIKRVDEELQEGKTFDESYENWLGIDARSVENYKESIGLVGETSISVPAYQTQNSV